MRNWLSMLLIGSVLFASCKKNSNCNATPPGTVASATEISNIQAYLTANGITNAVQQQNGMFYSLDAPGSGSSPNLCSNISIGYRGNVFNNPAAFDSTNAGVSRSFTLNQLIAGWQLVLPLVKKGGSVTLYIPPSLGYGAQGAGSSVPGNSYLRFNINLVDVN